MTRGRTYFFLFSVVIVLALLGANMLGASAGDDADDSLYKHLSVFTEVLGLIRQAYVDETDVATLMAGALDGTTDALDPMSLFVPAAEVGGYLEARAAGNRFTGLTLLKERGVAYVVAVDPGSPAAEAGVAPSDLVAKIQGRSTRTMPLWEVQEQLVGAAGSRLELELLRLGETLNVSFELAAFDPPPVEFTDSPGTEPVGIVRLARFEPATAAGVRRVLERAVEEGRDRLLVDLRGISGGDAEAAYRVAELFVSGELGGLERKGNRLATFTGEAEPVWRGKLVVLISRGSLGAAEILATVLRQGAGAELVGERTFGWAGRQDSADLSSGARLFFTDAFYTGPDGEPIADSLQPDLRVDAATRGFRERDEPVSDLILDKGLERLRELASEEQERKAA